jgi:hypothetical protein
MIKGLEGIVSALVIDNPWGLKLYAWKLAEGRSALPHPGGLKRCYGLPDPLLFGPADPP